MVYKSQLLFYREISVADVPSHLYTSPPYPLKSSCPAFNLPTMLSTCQKKPAPTPKHPTSKKNDIPTAPAEPLYKASGQPMPDKDAAKEQPRNSKTIRRWKLILALFLPNFLASLDVTIVAPAIPAISSHFGLSTLPSR